MSFSINNKTILNKKIFNSFKIIYGFGLNSPKLTKLLQFLGVSYKLKMSKLTEDHITKIKFFFENSDSIYQLEDIYRKNQLALSKILNIPSYKSIRLKMSLPIRGQRTHGNAKSCKKNKLLKEILKTSKF